MQQKSDDRLFVGGTPVALWCLRDDVYGRLAVKLQTNGIKGEMHGGAKY